jgi:hypothetical protein
MKICCKGDMPHYGVLEFHGCVLLHGFAYVCKELSDMPPRSLSLKKAIVAGLLTIGSSFPVVPCLAKVIGN